MSPRPPPKISVRHDWTKELGSKVDRQPQEEVARQPREEVARRPQEEEVSRQAKFFQPTQRIPKPICDRSGQLDNKHEVFVDKGETSWSQEIKEKSSHEELCSSDRLGQPDITPSVIRAQTNLSGEIRVEKTHDRSGQPDKHEFALRAAPELHREITMCTCSRRCRCPSMINILCTAFWVPCRVIRTIRCCSHPESFVDSVVGLFEEHVGSGGSRFLNQFSNAGTLQLLHSRMW